MEISVESASLLCPCCSGLTYQNCCKPFHNGGLTAPTPEALMRSRYTAYCRGLVDYIIKTTHRDHPGYQRNRGNWRFELARYCRTLQGKGLMIEAVEPATEQITDATTEAKVQFAATLQVDHEPVFVLRERSQFIRSDETQHRWLYHSGVELQ
jgi:SEC-C motif domain protein